MSHSSFVGNSHQSSCAPAEALQNEQTRMLISSVMHMSISEDGRNSTGALKRATSGSSSTASVTSHSSIQGWGSASSRASYRTGLCDISDDTASMEANSRSHYCPVAPTQTNKNSLSSQSSEYEPHVDTW
eukprot:CAMPEP_0197456162 /NCGR_PEP_ID=MMETSP1175-20131217/42657_1 /TAXON_ID=1003142 /ORGANISM="Triceratium dubium, Strain CCMP147" /LENGTH=129 /DNA_ID=CAMNT_0042990189 /DNA_START=131 /DNA_END=517 /DNA_ORIENTATION=-